MSISLMENTHELRKQYGCDSVSLSQFKQQVKLSIAKQDKEIAKGNDFKKLVMPMYGIGLSGMGKTDLAYEIANDTKRELRYFDLSTLGEDDFYLSFPNKEGDGLDVILSSQLPPYYIEKKETKKKTTNGETVEYTHVKKEKNKQKYLIVFDEFPNRSKFADKIMLTFILQRAIAGKLIAEDTYLLFLGNPSTSKYRGQRAINNTALGLRFEKYVIHPDKEEFLTYAQNMGMNPIVTSYIRENETFFYDIETHDSGAFHNFPNPRTMSALAGYLDEVDIRDPNNFGLLKSKIFALIGANRGSEFYTDILKMLEDKDRISIQDLIDDPKKHAKKVQDSIRNHETLKLSTVFTGAIASLWDDMALSMSNVKTSKEVKELAPSIKRTIGKIEDIVTLLDTKESHYLFLTQNLFIGTKINNMLRQGNIKGSVRSTFARIVKDTKLKDIRNLAAKQLHDAVMTFEKN